MFYPLLADGIASGAGEKLAAFVVKCLAVGGGLLVGYFVGAAAAWALDRWVFAHKAPAQLKKAVSLVCGLALALVVALIVFGDGGDGLFGGRGNQGDGKGTPTPEEKGPAPGPTSVSPKREDVPPKKEPSKPPEVPPGPGDVRVTILSGDDVREGRFFVVDGASGPKTFEELKESIAAKRTASGVEPTLVFRFKTEPLSDSHPAIRRLDAWLREAKLNNRFE
jgi:hypothetical protein